MPFILSLLKGGVATLEDYLLAHLPFVIPAFFLAGALYALFPKDKILRYLGPDSSKFVAYPMSVAAGLCLAVCSCTVLPLFAGIRKSGAGLGPAMVFLYTAPATNVLAIIYTSSLIGADVAIARIILSVGFAIIIGLSMAALFPDRKPGDLSNQGLVSGESARTPGWLWVFFVVHLAILMWGASPAIKVLKIKLIGLAILLVLFFAVARRALTRPAVQSWLLETWLFARIIVPLLLVGVFVAGMLRVVIPANFVKQYFGGTTVGATLAAVLFGVFAYFPTLVEVPMARMFLDIGVGRGPLLAYLLADPVISLPSILIVRQMIGMRRLLWYILIITLCCTAAGLIYGLVTK